MRRGDLHWADLAPRSGSEKDGRKPVVVVVVTSDGFNRTVSWGSIIVVPVTTSSRQQSRGPTAVALPAETAGLNKASVVLCHQITTLDRSKIGRRIGTLPKDLLSEVEDGIRAAIDIE